jgi:hypothetical protein
MELTLGYIVVITELIILYFAVFKNSHLAKLSSYVLFGALLLLSFISYTQGVFGQYIPLDSIASLATSIVIYGEIVLLLVLALTRLKKSSNKYMKFSLWFIIIVKILVLVFSFISL